MEAIPQGTVVAVYCVDEVVTKGTYGYVSVAGARANPGKAVAYTYLMDAEDLFLSMPLAIGQMCTFPGVARSVKESAHLLNDNGICSGAWRSALSGWTDRSRIPPRDVLVCGSRAYLCGAKALNNCTSRVVDGVLCAVTMRDVGVRPRVLVFASVWEHDESCVLS